jgi:hypothetical protein
MTNSARKLRRAAARSWVCALALSAALLSLPSGAAAYCRSTTVSPSAEDLAQHTCITSGYPLYWRDLEIHFGFNPARASQDLSDEAVREAFRQAFGTWAEVSCESGLPGLSFFEDQGAYSETQPSHTLEGANENAMLFRPADEWVPELGYPPEAFALTGVWFDLNSGRILGADMEINEGRGPFAQCQSDGCPAGTSDLQNVVTHEVGHLLGLAHSTVDGSTMHWSAAVGDLQKRDLHSDDVEGLCAVYAPSNPPPDGDAGALSDGGAAPGADSSDAGMETDVASSSGGNGGCTVSLASTKAGILWPLLTLIVSMMTLGLRRSRT